MRRTRVILWCHLVANDLDQRCFAWWSWGDSNPDPLLANYTRTDRDGARRALTPSLCSAQTVTVRHRCYRKQLQIGCAKRWDLYTPPMLRLKPLAWWVLPWGLLVGGLAEGNLTVAA